MAALKSDIACEKEPSFDCTNPKHKRNAVSERETINAKKSRGAN
jgi:hypothetical protein